VGSLPTPHDDGLLAFCTLAHELKQPLAAILSNAQAAWRFLAMDTPELTEVGAALHDIIADTHRTVEVMQRLQAFVTTGALEQTPLDINAVICEVIQLVRRDASRQHLTLSLDLAADLPMVLGDHIQLRQVLLNLVRNAFEAMQAQGNAIRTLAVRTTGETRDVVTIAVQDNGIGLDETSMARLFHPFFTTKAGGMGLGLALSRSIIAAHGGWIWAERNVQRGLTVSFTLPAL
jgi:two-component system sensor kinase FixL